MLQSEIPSALDKLAGTLQHIVATLEWQRLYFAELKQWDPLTFRPQDHTREQVMDLAAAFVWISWDIWQALHKKASETSIGRLKQWENRLQEIERAFGRLRLDTRFIRG
jgi:hypothetical protein